MAAVASEMLFFESRETGHLARSDPTRSQCRSEDPTKMNGKK